MAKIQFGNRQARVLCGLGRRDRLTLIADGLPVIHESAKSLWEAARQLNGHGREAAILDNLAEEEAAKALILMDIVRCPERCSSRIGSQVRWFYDHLARLVYSKAQSWRPTDLSQLREYVDDTRKGHYLEGNVGEYILPNSERYSRESRMYADIEVYEEGEPHWNDPLHYDRLGWGFRPIALELVDALHALGFFQFPGVVAANEIWNTVEFVDQENWEEARKLGLASLEKFEKLGLISERATDRHVHLILDQWQLPMYNLDFREIEVPLEQLEAERDAALWAEAGYHPAWG